MENQLNTDKASLINSFSFMREGVMLFCLAVLVFLIYSNTMISPFVFDDIPNIKNNTTIRLSSLTWEGIKNIGLEKNTWTRPVAYISFALNYYFHQYEVKGYHLVNTLIHIMAGIFLYFFVKTTLGIPSLRSKYGLYGGMPLIAASIWLVHPLHTQSVTYIVQRMNSMAAMFYVMSFLFYTKARLAEKDTKKWLLNSGCVLTGLLAIGSKQIAVTLPFFILLYEWYFFKDLNGAWLKRHALIITGLLILPVFSALVFLGVHPIERILSDYKTLNFTLIQRVVTEFRVVIYYITLLIFPHPSRLRIDYDFPISHSLFEPFTTLFSVGAMAGLLLIALSMAKKQRLLSFCILWFLGNLVVESSVIGLDIAFEHRTYLPSMLAGLIVVTLAYNFIKRKWLIAAIFSTLLGVFSIWTYERNSVWCDRVTLWRDSVQKAPKKARPQNNLGAALELRGNLKEAIHHYSQALQIKPTYAEAHNNLANVLTKQGKISEAIDHYSLVFQINPDFEEAHNNLGLALVREGKINQAIAHYSRALRINPDFEEAHNNLGIALVKKGRVNQAIAHYSQAIRINPEHAKAHNNLGSALLRKGEIEKAIFHVRKALDINPDYAKAHNNLGVAFIHDGRIEEAIYHFRQALEINPGYDDAKNNLRKVLEARGKAVK